MGVTVTTVSGTDVSRNPVVSCTGTPFLSLPGEAKRKAEILKVDMDTLSKHMLLIGGTGCGKTNLMFRIVEQTINRMKNDDVMIIFDSKGDYYGKFGSRPNSVVIGNSPEYKARSQKWNIFEEVCADESGDESDVGMESCRINAMEIARCLFAQRMSNTTNSFFPSAAQDIFSSLLLSICRDARTDADARAHMDNKSLINYLQSSDCEELCAQLASYPDLRSTISYIEGENEQGQGVISEMYSVIRDIFIGVFAAKGAFSMRKFVRNRGKKILFIEYDLAIGSVLTPVYRLLIDLALKEALSQHNHGGNIYLFFDEFKLLPHLQHIDDAVNFGRGKGVKVFAGLQSIEQLYDIYGQSKGRSIAAGFSTVLAFKANDEATMKYVSGLYGRNMQLYEVIGVNNAVSTTAQSGMVIEDWVMCRLRPGEAIVCLPQIPPFVMRFTQYS